MSTDFHLRNTPVEAGRGRKSPDQSRYLLFILLSLLLHALLLLSVSEYQIFFQNRETVAKVEPQEVEIVTSKDSKSRKQIVETEKTKKSEIFKEDAYLGEQTQMVQKQTRAAQTAPFRSSVPGVTAQKSAPAMPQTHQLSDLGVKANLSPLGHLNPQQRADAIAQSGATSDYLKDIENGSQTLLNTREFAYFSFYRRVRLQLEQYWEPGLRNRIRKLLDRGRHIASEREHSTRLNVVLNDTGQIIKIQVEDTSGISDLDQAAIDAFNRAGPFPNPPRGMIGSDGTVNVEWEFILKT